VKGLRALRPSQPTEAFAPPAALDLSAVYDEHADTVFRWAARLAGPRLDPEDLMQEIFLVVRDRLAEFRGDAKLTTWLYRITVNVVRDRRRRESRRWMRNLVWRAQAEIAAPGPTPVDELERRRDSELVYRALDSMNERYRTALILFEIEGLSGPEIVELTGQPLEALWVTLHRARAQLRERILRLEPSSFERSRT
jgi:RNA polymerase sigma-70 factor (ECF subfamily)